MSDTSQGPGWWIASDGKWYSPEQKPGPATPEPPAATPTPVETAAPQSAPVEPAAAQPAEPGPMTPADVAPMTPAPATPPPFAPEAPPAAVEPPTEPIPMTPPPGSAPPPMAPPPMAPPPMAPPPMGAPPVPPPGTPPPMMTPPAGGYAAPPPMATSVAAAPEKKGNGCLKAALIVGGILVVLGIGTFIALAFLVNKGVDTVNDKLKAQQKVEDRTGIKSNSFNTEHPPQDDLVDWKCSTTAGGFPQVTGSVKNNSSHTSSYAISVEFKQNGTEFDTGSGLVVSVDPNQSSDFSATGSVKPTGQFTCKIDTIDRTDIAVDQGN
ncbi:MAG: hypothetical protein ACXWA3_09425 [Acidimicrobiales bacterium]